MYQILVVNATFTLGQIVATSGVHDLASQNPEFGEFMQKCLNRHVKRDWGDLCQEDKQENDLSLKKGLRLLSAYETEGLPKIWIITEADRSTTTILFPDEY